MRATKRSQILTEEQHMSSTLYLLHEIDQYKEMERKYEKIQCKRRFLGNNGWLVSKWR